MMRYYEINPPRSHPYTATIIIERVRGGYYQTLADEASEVRLLNCEVTDPGLWKMTFACASEEVATKIEENWD